MERSREQAAVESIAEEMRCIPGHLGFYYKNLVTGLECGVRAEEAFGAASVIKLPLYLHILAQSAQGALDMGETLTVTEGDKVPICGALTLFTGEVNADIQTLCRLMISLSDNTATNRLIRYCTIGELQKGFRQMGLERTVLRRRLFDDEASAAGIENSICPREIGMLLEKLYRHELFNPALCKQAVDTLLLQQVDHKLNGKLCGRVEIAHKTGEDDALSNDVGIVYAEQPFVICFAGENTDVYRWEDLMRRGTFELVMAQQEM